MSVRTTVTSAPLTLQEGQPDPSGITQYVPQPQNPGPIRWIFLVIDEWTPRPHLTWRFLTMSWRNILLTCSWPLSLTSKFSSGSTRACPSSLWFLALIELPFYHTAIWFSSQKRQLIEYLHLTNLEPRYKGLHESERPLLMQLMCFGSKNSSNMVHFWPSLEQMMSPLWASVCSSSNGTNNENSGC